MPLIIVIQWFYFVYQLSTKEMYFQEKILKYDIYSYL